MRSLIVFVLVSLTALAAEAQERKLTPEHEEFVQAVGINNEAGQMYLRDFHRLFPELSPPSTGIDTVEKLATYVRKLEPFGCPSSNVGQVCLYDSDAKLWVASLTEKKFASYPDAGPPKPVSAASRALVPKAVNHWATKEECLAATGAPWYYPLITSSRKPLSSSEEIGPYEGGCVYMDLPESLGGIGWVRIEAGREVIRNKMTGEVLRLASCDNVIHAQVPFPAPERVGGPDRPITEALKKEVHVTGEILHKLEGQVAEPEAKGKPWYDWMRWERNSGKLFWGGVGAAAVVCGFKCRHKTTTEVYYPYPYPK